MTRVLDKIIDRVTYFGFGRRYNVHTGEARLCNPGNTLPDNTPSGGVGNNDTIESEIGF